MLEVILPFHVCDKYFEFAVASLLESVPSHSIITLVDDRLQMNHSEFLSQILDKKNIRYIRNNKHGYGNALNLAISQSRAKYLALMNSDDISHPQRFSLQLKAIEESGSDLVSTGLQKFSDHGLHQQMSGRFTQREFFSAQLFFGSYSADASILFRTSWLAKQKNFLDIDMSDYVFALNSYPTSNVVHLNDSLYFYRQHKNQSTVGNRIVSDYFFNSWKFLAEHFGLPTASHSLIGALALPSFKFNLAEEDLDELFNWIDFFQLFLGRNFSQSSHIRANYEKIIQRRILAVCINNPHLFFKILMERNLRDLTYEFRNMLLDYKSTSVPTFLNQYINY